MAKFNCAWLIHKQQFRSQTGIKPYTFLELVARLRPHWRERIEAPKNRSGRPWGVDGVEDHLRVLLILNRCAITQDFMACLYQTNKSTISRSLRWIEAVAARVLGVTRVVGASREEAEALIIDSTEQPTQGPGRKQRCWYSGKKKRHTIKTEIVITENGRIVSIAKPVPGRVHDLEIRRRGPPLPSSSHIYADSGYQGLQDDHSGIDIPYKKTKTEPLTKDERTYNLALSRLRVRVEHSIGRLKSFRILSERYRYPRGRYAVKISTVAGIINFTAGF